MKFYLEIGLFLYFSIIGQAQHTGFSPQELQCISETGVDKNHIEKIILDDSSRFLIENDTEFNKFLHCFFVVRDLQDLHGELNYENIIHHVKEFSRKHFGGKSDDESKIGLEIATKAVQSCKHLSKGTTYGETAVKAQNCIDKRMIELVQEDV